MTNLKRIRLQAGLEQKEIAEMIGISARTLQNYEQGRRTLSLKTAVKIAKVLNCNIEHLLDREDE